MRRRNLTYNPDCDFDPDQIDLDRSIKEQAMANKPNVDRLMCYCISYNKPEWAGVKPEVIVPTPEWSDRQNDTISLDACIANDILRLWENGVRTLGSCCGHNRAAPSIVIEVGQDIDLIKSLVPDFEIYQWELTRK